MRLTDKELLNHLIDRLQKMESEVLEKEKNERIDGETKAGYRWSFEQYKKENKDEYRYIKLGLLEDIEEELGIDLITLFKALKSRELYWKTNHYGIIKTTFDSESLRPEVGYNNYKDNEWSIRLVSNALDDDELLKDYGKTWALTKEELCK